MLENTVFQWFTLFSFVKSVELHALIQIEAFAKNTRLQSVNLMQFSIHSTSQHAYMSASYVFFSFSRDANVEANFSGFSLPSVITFFFQLDNKFMFVETQYAKCSIAIQFWINMKAFLQLPKHDNTLGRLNIEIRTSLWASFDKVFFWKVQFL